MLVILSPPVSHTGQLSSDKHLHIRAREPGVPWPFVGRRLRDLPIVSAIIAIPRNLHMEVIAEGIESLSTGRDQSAAN
jgi:hypothetical protein